MEKSYTEDEAQGFVIFDPFFLNCNLINSNPSFPIFTCFVFWDLVFLHANNTHVTHPSMNAVEFNELQGRHFNFLISFSDEISSKLFDAYKQELALKQIVVNEIAHISDPNLSLVFLSSWLYQPYIEDINKVLLESLLLETGHRMLT